MGGATPIYLRPVPNYGDRWLSSFSAHTRRNPPSKEPGVDYYCPLGTTLVSIGDGYVSEIGGGLGPATGRYVKVNLDNGQSFRLLHLGPRHSLKRLGERVQMGEPLAISGASGYGSEWFGATGPSAIPPYTGGPHTHATLFPTWRYNNFQGLLDLELFVDKSAPAGGGASPFPLPEEKDEDMADNLTIYRKGGDLHALGFNRDFYIGGALTQATGVDGQRTLDVLVKGGAEVKDLTQNEWDVMEITLKATEGKPPAAQIDVKALAAALAPLLPNLNAASVEDVENVVAKALGSLILAPVKLAQ